MLKRIFASKYKIQKSLKMFKQYLFLLLIYVWQIHCQQDTIDFIRLQYPSECTPAQFFDEALLECRACPTNSVQHPQRQTECQCAQDYRITVNNESVIEHVKHCLQTNYGGYSLTCEQCPAGQVATPSGWDCIPCTQSTGAANNTCQQCNGR
jgi:hypothetical protein